MDVVLFSVKRKLSFFGSISRLQPVNLDGRNDGIMHQFYEYMVFEDYNISFAGELNMLVVFFLIFHRYIEMSGHICLDLLFQIPRK